MAADRRQWDVFLSFRGEDTRHGFTKTLYEALTDLGVRAFLDDDGLRRGDEIAPSLLEAIEDSAAAVVILSAKYADSRWCLEELSRICQLSATRRVLPVFYFVDPSHVRKQTGPFENDFRAHEARFGKVVVARWRKGMETVGNFAGFPVFDHSQEKHIIKSLVKTVMDEMAKTPVNLEYTVGLEPSIEKLTRLLELKSNGVKVLGLYGMGGIGKTTLAKALFNHLVGRAGFESRSFVPNVREITARENGLESLRKKLAQDLSADKKSLVVLDDVDDAEQVKALVLVKGELFFDGSRIIVTTRDREALPEKIVSVKYEVRELDSEGALKLFSHHAQRREEPTENLRSISREIVSLTGGLPLALEVFGSMLLDKRRVEEWRDSLQKLREIRPANLQDVLKMSYNGLDEQEKCVFLDIACLFAGMSTKRDYLVDVLAGCGFNGEIAISDLTSKSLVKINDENVVSMHDQIRDMGRQIVKEESVADPRSQSRLWNRDDIMALLLDDQRRTCVEGISLDYEAREKMVRDVDGGRIAWDRLHRSPNLSNALSFLKERYKQYKEDEAERMKEIKILGKAVERIPNLRLLRVNNVSLEGDFEFPHQLKWLQWKGCPLKGLRSDIYAKGLVVVDLSQSKIERFWSRRDNKASLRNIRNLSMPGSKIPTWFTRDVIKFTKHRNRLIKGVAVCAVVSLDRSIQDENIDSVPGIVDIQAQILKQDLPVFTTAFNLKGVPRRSEDQIHLCRFSGENPLVSQLKDGFKIAVTRRNPPFMKGVELKKWGVHLIYEGDDDYEGDEESLKESQQSTSEKLGKFFSTYEEEEKEEEDPEISGRAEEFSLPFHIMALSLLLVLCSWFYYSSYYAYS